MRLRTVVLALLVAALALPGLSHAQTNQSLVILAGEDLWLYDGTNLTNLTNDGHIQEAALSPFSTHIAYTTWSPMTVSAAERMGGIGGGTLPPYDVKVIDLATYEITTIAVQPADASLLADGVPDSAILRAGVTWSPDGHRLAWGEVHYPSFAAETNRLVVFDFLQGDTAVLATNLPEQTGVPMPVRSWWGSAGLAVASYEFDRATTTYFTRILVYSDQDGTLISATRTSEDAEAQFTDFLWVSGGGKD